MGKAIGAVEAAKLKAEEEVAQIEASRRVFFGVVYDFILFRETANYYNLSDDVLSRLYLGLVVEESAVDLRECLESRDHEKETAHEGH